MARERGFALVIAAGIFGVALLLAEIIARYAFAREQRHLLDSEEEYRRTMHVPPYVWKPFLNQVHVPNYSSPTCSTDERGLRNRSNDAYRPKAQNVFRVFLLGGSTALGTGAPDGETLADHLRADLRLPGKNVQVVNAGQAAFTSSQEFVQLSLFLMDFEPNLCILLDGRNDFYFGTRPDWQPHINYRMNRFSDWYNNERLRAIRSARFFSGLVQDIKMLGQCTRLAQLVLGLLKGPGSSANGRPDHPDHVEESAIVYARNVRRMNAILADAGVPFAVFLQPSLLDSSKHLSTKEAVLREQAESGESFFDAGARKRWSNFSSLAAAYLQSTDAAGRYMFHSCVPAFDSMGQNQDAFLDDCHLTPAGQKVLSRFMVDRCQTLIAGALYS